MAHRVRITVRLSDRRRCQRFFIFAAVLAWLILSPLRASAQDDAAARDAASDPFVPLDEVQSLSLPDTDIPQELLGRPVLRVEVTTVGKAWKTNNKVNLVRKGEPLTAEVARRAMREVAQAGTFAGLAAQATAEGDGVVLRVVAVPSRIVADVQIEGSVLERSATLKAAKLAPGGEVTEASLDAAKTAIEAHYAAHGFRSADVSIQAAPLDDPKSVLVAIQVEPGTPQLVTQRVFVIEPAADVEVGDLKFSYAVEAGDRLDEGALTEADRGLSQALREAGFYSARVYHKVKDLGPFAYLYVYVESGPRLVPIFEGNRSFDADQLTEALELDKGQLSNPDELATRLVRHYKNHGFHDVEISVERRQSESRGIEYIAMIVRENARVRVVRRLLSCLPADIDPDDVGSEIDAFLEEDLPSETFISVPDPSQPEIMLSSNTPTGARPAPLELTPASVYTSESYARVLKHLRELYISRGYLNAQIGPVGVIRPRCSPSSPPGECIEIPVYRPPPVCKTDDVGVPLPEPPLPSESTCLPDPDNGVVCSPRIVLRVPMHLGQKTTLYDLTFEGNRVMTEEDLADIADLDMGEPASLDAIEEARTRITVHYQDEGYAYAEVQANVETSPNKKLARVIFTIREHDRVYVDDIEIEGALRTDEALIRRRLAFERGDVLKRKDMRVSEERLATLGVFSSVSVSMVEPEVRQRRKRVVVRVAEYPSQYLDPKVGFSTGEGLRFGFEYGHRNIGGLAIALTLRVQLSYLFDFMIIDSAVEENLGPLPASERLERRNSARVSFPEIGLGPLVGFAIEAVDIRDNQRDFGLTREAFVPSLTYRPTRELLAALSASVELNDVTIFNADSVAEAIRNNRDLERLLRFPDGTTFAVAQRVSFSWDRRDSPFAATAGTLMTLDVEHVNAFPADPDDPETDPLTSHFLKMSTRLAAYVRFTQSGVALAVSVGAGYNLQLADDSKTYPDRLFFLGGFDSMRSFYADSVVPQDVADQILDPPRNVAPEDRLQIEDVAVRGGDVSINPRIELRVPLTGTFAVGLFLDTGNLWVDPAAFNPFELRYGAGAGLRVTTPIGPLAFDYGFNLDRRDWEDVGALHFSIGLF